MRFADANCCGCCCCPSCCCKPIIIKLPPPPVKLCPCCCGCCCCRPCCCCCCPCCCGCGGGGGGYGRKKRSVVDLMAKKFSDILLPQFNQDAFIPMGCGAQSSITPLQSLCAKIPPIQRGPACQQLIAQQPQFPLSQNIFNQQQQMMGAGGTMLNGGGMDSLGNNGEMSDCQCSGACNNNGQIPLMNSQSQQFGSNGCTQQQCNVNAADAINCQQQMGSLNGGQGCNNGAFPQATNGACMGDGNNNNNFYNLPSFGGGVMMDSSNANNNNPSLEGLGSSMHSPVQNNMLSNSGSTMPCGGDTVERGIGRVGRGLGSEDLLANIGGGSSIFDVGRKKRFLVLLKKKALGEELNSKSDEGYEKGKNNRSEAKREANKNQQNESLVFRNNLEFVVRQSPQK
uniref:Uncharacterized protein n=1 Tax=Meloidogyne incognita TaxID=6306 RepID=A0A914MYL0_MELIC